MITIADRSSKKRHIRSFRSPVVEVLGLYYEVTTSHLGADSPPKVICIAPVLGSTSPRERQQLSKSADLQQLLDRGGVLIYPGMSACTDIEQEVHELIDRAREIEKSIYETDVERFRKEQFADRATFAFCGRAQHRLKEVVVDLEKELRCEYQNHVRGVERLQQDLLRFESDNATVRCRALCRAVYAFDHG